MSDIRCTILSEEPPIQFAKKELEKYAKQAVPFSFVLGTGRDFVEGGLLEESILQGEEPIDAFQLLVKEDKIYIIGSNSRSVLFGVYHACKKLFGYRWVNFLSIEEIEYKEYRYEEAAIHRGKMKRRGLVVENYDDITFLFQLIDWAAKHYINELFFTFMLWDKVKHSLAIEIEKRGLSITIGGHSMHYLVEGAASFAKNQIDFSDKSWRTSIITRIKETCKESASITRVSLWPADIGIQNDQHFLAHYIEFAEQIQKELPDIAVEHIAYNAGLSWEMLEHPADFESSKTVDTLFAYWGRNYHQAFTEEKRAFAALQKWCQAAKVNQKQVTVFEYYSDHFMLGDLFPPLFQRIHEDIEMYSGMGIKQIVNLIVPYIPKDNPFKMDRQYPWEAIQLLNSYYFARLTWGDAFDEIEKDFYSAFGEHQPEVIGALKKMEVLLSGVSKWNVPLFPSRLIDLEKVENFDDVQTVIRDIVKLKQEIEPLRVNAAGDMNNLYSMMTFYIDYVCVKADEYLQKWKIQLKRI